MITYNEELSEFAGGQARRWKSEGNYSFYSFENFKDLSEKNNLLFLMSAVNGFPPAFLTVFGDERDIYVHQGTLDSLPVDGVRCPIKHEVIENFLRKALEMSPYSNKDDSELIHPIVDMLSHDEQYETTFYKMASSLNSYLTVAAIKGEITARASNGNIFSFIKESAERCREDLFCRFSTARTLLDIVNEEHKRSSPQ